MQPNIVPQRIVHHRIPNFRLHGNKKIGEIKINVAPPLVVTITLDSDSNRDIVIGNAYSCCHIYMMISNVVFIHDTLHSLENPFFQLVLFLMVKTSDTWLSLPETVNVMLETSGMQTNPSRTNPDWAYDWLTRIFILYIDFTSSTL